MREARLKIDTQRNKQHAAYLQSQVTPTQTMVIQTRDDTPIIATRITTADHTDIGMLEKCTQVNYLTAKI